jgi:hypothetical protein
LKKPSSSRAALLSVSGFGKDDDFAMGLVLPDESKGSGDADRARGLEAMVIGGKLDKDVSATGAGGNGVASSRKAGTGLFAAEVIGVFLGLVCFFPEGVLRVTVPLNTSAIFSA